MIKYVAKPDNWFDAGTEVKLIDDYSNPPGNVLEGAGLFEGFRNGSMDQEICLFEEFEVVDDKA